MEFDSQIMAEARVREPHGEVNAHASCIPHGVVTMGAMADPDMLWRNPAHWTTWGYNCKDDPRVIVPKRNPTMGWTMNWAHPNAIPMTLLMTVGSVLPTLVFVGLGALGALDHMTSFIGAVMSVPVTVVALVVVCKRIASAT